MGRSARMVKKNSFKWLILVLFIAIPGICVTKGAAHAGDVARTSDVCIGCHPDVNAFTAKKVVHQPVRQGKCTECHNPHTSKHAALLYEADSGLCFRCHERKGFVSRVVHKPVKEGKCLVCHNPHSSSNRGLLDKPAGQTCLECHKKEDVMGGKYVHPEVKQLKCDTCHSPHNSELPGLLIADAGKICSDCHYGNGASGSKPCAYNVRGSDCMSCHSPHSSDNKGILKATLHKPFADRGCSACHGASSKGTVKKGTALCTDCHDKSLDSFNRVNSHAVAGKSGRFCDNCHNPHASDAKHLLKGKESKVCYSCHEDTERFVGASKHVHPDLVECSNCHTAHGSNEQFFLKQGGETCSAGNCHASQGTFTHPVGDKVIDPRSKTPMDCSTCHNPMGSPEDSILRWGKDMELCVKCHQV